MNFSLYNEVSSNGKSPYIMTPGANIGIEMMTSGNSKRTYI